MTNSPRPGFIALRFVFIGLLLLVGWGALQPSAGPALLPYQDKFIHAGAYAVLYVAGALAYGGRLVSWPLHLSLLTYGAVIEWLQSRTGYRYAEWADMAANAVGLGLGNLAIMLLERFRRR